MNVLIAPNAMKGSLDAFRVADIIAQAFLDVSGRFQIRKLPVADGGDGTGQVLAGALRLSGKSTSVHDPLGRLIEAPVALGQDLAVIEMANASGAKLLKSWELNPMVASSKGTGELIRYALASGVKNIWLGLGGSATVDAGMGILEALGYQFYDKHRTVLSGNGKNTGLVAQVEIPDVLPKWQSFCLITDVDNPLLGEHGAARVFAPQKGADRVMIDQLERNLVHFTNLTENVTGRRVVDLPGGGAAGGVAASLVAYLGAQIVPGAEFVLNQLQFDRHVAWANLVITGEGRLDRQTQYNKAPAEVARRARTLNRPVIAVCGQAEASPAKLFDQVEVLKTDLMSTEYAIQQAPQLLYKAAGKLAVQWLKVLDHD